MSSPSIEVSTSVAEFLLVTSICCILSLSCTDVLEQRIGTSHGADVGIHQIIRIPNYIPDIAMLCVMSIGIVAMAVFIVKRRDLTVEDHELSRRHKLHRKYSLRSINAFFIGVCILGANYIVVELSCVDRWAHCYDNRVFLVNLFELIFHVVFIAFAICEVMVCCVLRDKNFKRSRWVWHGLAIVQAANIALWFGSLVKESGRRINDDVHSFDAYFRLCNATHVYHNHSHERCSTSSIGPRWFIISSPFLYPIAIEFSLLVSETFLDKTIGTKHTNCVDENSNIRCSHNFHSYNNAPTEQTPLLASQYENSSSSKIFILLSEIISVVYLVLSILTFIGNQFYTSDRPSYFQTFTNFFTAYRAGYMVFLVICCGVGMLCCRRLERHPSHTSFLEYLLLFATVGGLCQAVKRIEAYAVNRLSSSFGHSTYVYYAFEIVDMIEILLQIVFYYYVKDVKLNNDGKCADSAARNTVVVIAMSNLATWISDSFLLPDMSSSITPSNYFIEQWPVFDNVMNPIVIFFRFNSSLLFWCIYVALARS